MLNKLKYPRAGFRVQEAHRYPGSIKSARTGD